MQRPILLATLASAMSLLGTSETNAALVAYWNFNDLSITTASAPGNGGVPTSITADQGSGTVQLTAWGGLVDDFSGSTINALGADPAGASLSLVSNAGNGSHISISFPMTGLENPVVTFATRGTSTGYNSGTWSWSTNGVDFTAVAGTNTATTSTTYGLASVDLSAIDDLDGASSVTLRYQLDGATSTSGNNRIDNLQVTAIPEPAAVLFGSIGLLALLRRRR